MVGRGREGDGRTERMLDADVWALWFSDLATGLSGVIALGVTGVPELVEAFVLRSFVTDMGVIGLSTRSSTALSLLYPSLAAASAAMSLRSARSLHKCVCRCT